jgi:solute carrier family 8 (sodium/calcium exchanger)
MLPGMYLLSKPVLIVAYLFGLGYMFLGIAIISDIFMEAIETITSIQVTEELWDADQKQKYYVDVPLWNATVANLTLMALGSSAPEILLSVIGTVQDIRARPSELGPSTIVGSAAFNLLVITGLSIIAVDDTPKKIDDTGVFFITSVCSLWAYIWMYLVLQIWSKD